MEKVILECMVCHKKEIFKSCKEAFAEGWDCPPYFSYTACPHCFTAEVIKILEGKPSPYKYKSSSEIYFAE